MEKVSGNREGHVLGVSEKEGHVLERGKDHVLEGGRVTFWREGKVTFGEFGEEGKWKVSFRRQESLLGEGGE